MNICPELGVPCGATTAESLFPLFSLAWSVQHLGGLPLLALLLSRLCISMFGSLEFACLATWPSNFSLLKLIIYSTVFILALARI